MSVRRAARIVATVVGALLAGLVVLWVGAFVWSHARPLPSADTPSGLVRRYFGLVGAGREVEAARLRVDEPPPPGWLAWLPVVPSDELALHGLRVDFGTRWPDDEPAPSFASGYRDVTYVGANFTQYWGDGMTTDAGKQYRAVIVGRKSPSSPWVILAVGTGG